MKKILVALPVMVGLLISCSNKKRSVAYNASYCKEHVVKIKRFLGSAEKTKRDRVLKSGKGTEDNELRLTEKSNLYINEAWDIGIADETPENVQEYVSKGTTSGSVYRKR